MRKPPPTLTVVVADTQCNYHVGLCPPSVRLDKGGTYIPNKPQQASYAAFKEFCRDMEVLGRKHKAEIVAIVAGDAADRNAHDGVGLISTNDDDIVSLTCQALTPLRKIAKFFFMVRGTKAHVGSHAHLEETVAKTLQSVQDEETGAWAWWHLPIERNGVRFDITHHPRHSGWVEWTRQGAVDREAFTIAVRHWKRHLEPPDIAIRGHLHYFAESDSKFKPHTFQCPSWQLLTEYERRRGADGFAEPLGGLWFLTEEGRYTWDAITYEPTVSQVWTGGNLVAPKKM